MELLQIVPALPPAFSGIGDFAMLLARELSLRHGVGSRFVVGDPAWNSPAAVAPFAAASVAARTPAALRDLLASSAGPVLLHYVGYGYAQRGCPFWLVDALETWKRSAAPPRKLLVLFHEVAASGPPWSSAFWTSPFQRQLAARLARVADARRITTTISLGELRALLGRRDRDLPVTVANVFSTLGEPSEPLPSAARERQIVVFGSRPVREQVYARANELETFCHRHEIGQVVDVGTPIPGGIQLGVNVRETGPLPAAEASALFSRSLAGYFTYPAPHLGKSTIFAAYCAHRMTPVTFPGNDDPGEGLRAGEHFLVGAEDAASFDAVASAAHAWYGAHRLEIHASDIFRTITTYCKESL